jgi:hypothetical protein
MQEQPFCAGAGARVMRKALRLPEKWIARLPECLPAYPPET